MSNMNRVSFFWRWVAVITVTLALGTMAAFVSMWTVGEMVGELWGEWVMGPVVGAIFGALLGVGLGAGQAFVLRPHGVPAIRWLVYTVLGAATGMALGFTLVFIFFDMDTVPEIAAGLLIALSVGLPIGLVQWQMLKTFVRQAHLWVPICLVAFIVGFGVGLNLEEWLAAGAIALLTAVVSGLGMIWLVGGVETVPA